MKDLEKLFDFYQIMNKKNNEILNLEDFEIDNENIVNVKEDIVENIGRDLEVLENIIQSLNKLDLNRNLEQINYDFEFHNAIARLIGVYADLSSEFLDLYQFHTKFVQSLPEGPKDDSDLIK